jgi:hypothetical protein
MENPIVDDGVAGMPGVSGAAGTIVSEEPAFPAVPAMTAAPAQPADTAAVTPAERNKALDLLKSRKFWAAVVGLGIVVMKAYKPDFPLSEAEITNLVYVLIAYILGTALDRPAVT